MGNVKLGGRLPMHPDLNGMDDLSGHFVGNTEDLVPVVAVLSTRKVENNLETGTVIPTVGIKRIEPILNAEDKEMIDRIVQRAFERRTGKAVLPLELEDELRGVFEGGEGDESK